MKKKLILLLTALSMLSAYIPSVYAETVKYWVISDFTQSEALTVTEKSCTDGIVTLKGTALNDKLVAATVYSEENELISMGQANVSEDGAFTMTIGLRDGEEKGTILIKSASSEKISADIELITEKTMFDELDEMKSELETLTEKCNNAGIPIDYAMVKVSVADKFTQFLREDLESGNASRLTEHFEYLKGFYAEAKSEMMSYLSGEVIPEDVPRYITSDKADETDGSVLISDTEYEGETVRRPVYYIGYVGWDDANEDMDWFDEMGMNYLHTEISPNSVLLHPDVAKDWEYYGGGFIKPGTTAELVSGVGRNGSSAVKIVNTTTPDTTAGATHSYGNAGIKQTVAVKANTTYKLSFYIKGTGISSSSYYKVGGSDRQRFKSSYDDYTKVEYSYKTGADETSITISFVTENENTELYIDDVTLMQAWSTKNLLSNSDFEGGEADNSNLREGFKINQNALDNLKSVFKKAEDNNISVALLFALHNFPSFISAEDSNIDNDGKIYSSFMPINPTHPRVKEVLSLFATVVMETVGDSKALNSVVLANEPAFVAGHGGGGNPNYYYLEKFREFLKDRYGTISALNAKYSSQYASFDEIQMPAWGNMLTSSKSKLAVDYRDFNDNIVTELHEYLDAAVKKAAPNVKTHTKMMAYLHENAADETNTRNTNGNDYEAVSKHLDYNGYDGGAIKGSSGQDSLQAELSWLDFIHSVKDMPSFNIEDHAMSGEYTADQADWIYGYLWQGALHGKAGSALWLWDRTDSILSGSLKDTVFTTRPRETAAAGKAALDIGKFADKLALFEKKPARVALFYSDISSYWNNNYINALYESYCDIMYTGQKVDYITENAPEKLNEGDYDVLVVPWASNVPEDVLNEIIKFKQSGGTVILTEDTDGAALAKDRYGDAHSASLVSSARSGCEIVKYSSVGKWYDGDYHVYDENGTIAGKIRSVISATVKDADVLQIKDATTGKAITNAEYRYTEDSDGNVLIYIYSFESSVTKNVNVYYNGKKLTSSTELISGTAVGESVALKPYTPILLSDGDRDVRISINTVENDEIKHFNGIAAGNIITKFEIPSGTLSDSQSAVCITAVYEDGALVKCAVTPVSKTGSDISEKTTLTLDSVTNGTTVKAFVFNEKLEPIAQVKQAVSVTR